MEVIDIKNDKCNNEALLKKKKFFEEMYNKQNEERENMKKMKQIIDEQTKDPKELMLNIQTTFCNLYESNFYFLSILIILLKSFEIYHFKF